MSDRHRRPQLGLRAHFLIVGLLALLPFLATTAYTAFEFHAEARNVVESNIRYLLVFASQLSADLLRTSENYVLAAAGSANQPEARPGTDREHLRQLLIQRHEYVGGGLLRADGTSEVVGGVDKVLESRLRQSSFMKRVHGKSGPVVGQPLLDPALGEAVIPIGSEVPAHPADAPDVAFVLVSVEEIRQDLEVLLRSFPEGTEYLGATGEGTILMSGPDGAFSDLKSAAGLWRQIPEQGRSFVSTGPDGKSRLWRVAKVGDGGLFENELLLGVGVPTSAIYSSAYRMTGRNVLGLFLAAVLVVVIGLWLLEMKALRPLRSALTAVVRLGEGDYAVRLDPPFPGGFVGKLLRSVNRTADLLQQDESERQRLFNSLIESESQYHTLFDTSSDGILLLNERLEILRVNRAFASMVGSSGPDALVGSPISQFVDNHPFDELVRARRLTNGEMFSSEAIEINLSLPEGKTMLVEVTLSRSASLRERGERYVLIARDIRSRRRLEEEKRHLNEQLLHSQKMESIGLLAGSVAHDFNNLLTVVHGYVEFGKKYADSKEKVVENLNEIEKAALKAGDLTRQLLLFSRRQPVQRVLLEPGRLIQGLERMLKRLVGEQVELLAEVDERLWSVMGDRGSIEQSVMNLVVNSRDAMPDGGRLTIRAENRTIDEDYVRLRPEARAGRFVAVTVEDTGSGMSHEVLSHVFEPFYTTKERGRGTGLGLSVVFGVVQQHGGWIDVESSPGTGTSICLLFPATTSTRGALDLRSDSLPAGGGKGEHVLVVEDDESIRKLVCQTLSEYGYTVFSAGNKKAALELLGAGSCPELDLLFCDALLPDGNGLEVGRVVVGRNPEAKIVYCSGHTDDNRQIMTLRDLGFPFLNKPFTVDSLLKMVRATLDEARRS